jgi:hypothetical protein
LQPGLQSESLPVEVEGGLILMTENNNVEDNTKEQKDLGSLSEAQNLQMASDLLNSYFLMSDAIYSPANDFGIWDIWNGDLFSWAELYSEGETNQIPTDNDQFYNDLAECTRECTIGEISYKYFETKQLLAITKLEDEKSKAVYGVRFYDSRIALIKTQTRGNVFSVRCFSWPHPDNGVLKIEDKNEIFETFTFHLFNWLKKFWGVEMLRQTQLVTTVQSITENSKKKETRVETTLEAPITKVTKTDKEIYLETLNESDKLLLGVYKEYLRRKKNDIPTSHVSICNEFNVSKTTFGRKIKEFNKHLEVENEVNNEVV